jgi:hypothetical protein
VITQVLRIIREIITNTNDISLIEASVGTWDAVCRHQDHSTLAADISYRTLYEENVTLYASLAKNSTKKLGKSTQPVARHDATRLRKAGVAAIKSMFSPVEVATWWTAQLDATLPAVISNLRHDEPSYLERLQRSSDENEDDDRLKKLNRRMSVAASRTFSGMQESGEADPRAAEGSAQDADNLEEEEVGVLAISCLRAIFQTQNRAQTRGAALVFLKYVSDEQDRLSPRPATENLVGLPFTEWATTIFRMITSWTPVQERFILLITAVETLRQSPLQNTDLRANLLYADLIDAVLRSQLNLIGLSVMDVLLGLLDQLQRVAALTASSTEQKQIASSLLKQRLQSCIADLATHVYYSDQITDMISTIIARIKPDPTSTGQRSPPSESNGNAADSSPPASNPKSSTQDFGYAPATVPTMSSRPTTRDRNGSLGTPSGTGPTSQPFFSTSEARQIALFIIHDILTVAAQQQQPGNEASIGTLSSSTSATMPTSRSPVPGHVWYGTTWLLEDPDPAIPRAYRAALAVWAESESDEKDSDLLDLDSSEPLAKLFEKHRPTALAAFSTTAPSLRGSLSPSTTPNHRQLLLAPLNGQSPQQQNSPGTPPHASSSVPILPTTVLRARSASKVSSSPTNGSNPDLSLAGQGFAMLSASNTLAGNPMIGGSGFGSERGKLRVRYQDLKDLCEGRSYPGGVVGGDGGIGGGLSRSGSLAGARGVEGGRTAEGGGKAGDSVGRILSLLDSLGLEERAEKPLGTTAAAAS